jgi:hypothetical protein
MRQGGRRAIQALLLCMPAVLALAAASARPDANGPVLPSALGRPAPHASPTRTPARGVHVEITRGGYRVRHGETAVALAGSPAGGSWQRFAHGAQRTTPFGRETVVVGPTTTEQFLTVDRRQGERTWRWRIDAGELTPRLAPDGSVAFSDGALAGIAVEPARILTTGGRDVTPAGLRWSLERKRGSWWLSLHVDDARLPLPYVIDPAITLRSAASFANNAGGSGSLTINKPTGAVQNDFLLAMVSVHGGAQRTITAPAGWTLLRRDDQANNLAQAVYYRVAA